MRAGREVALDRRRGDKLAVDRLEILLDAPRQEHEAVLVDPRLVAGMQPAVFPQLGRLVGPLVIAGTETVRLDQQLVVVTDL